MIEDSSKLSKGQILGVNIDKVNDRLPKKILKQLEINPIGKLVGYKMVDGNQFGLAIELGNGKVTWFFEEELYEVNDE